MISPIPEGLTLTPFNKWGGQNVFRPTEEYHIFDTHDWRLVGDALNDYVWQWYHIGDLQLKIVELKNEVKILSLQRDIETRRADRNDKAVQQLSDLLDKEQDFQEGKDKKDRLEKWIWGIGGILLVGLAAGGWGAYLSERAK